MEKETKQSKFKRICVFCGSSQGKKSSYTDAALELGRELVSRNIDLVYGGGSIGLMGLVSRAVYNGGRHVIGVIPKTLMPREVSSATTIVILSPPFFYRRMKQLDESDQTDQKQRDRETDRDHGIICLSFSYGLFFEMV